MKVSDPHRGRNHAPPPQSAPQVPAIGVDSRRNGSIPDSRRFMIAPRPGNQPERAERKALKADVDEAAWSSLYSTVSRPFEKPKTGKIAIKVINHYGDEVLKVYGV